MSFSDNQFQSNPRRLRFFEDDLPFNCYELIQEILIHFVVQITIDMHEALDRGRGRQRQRGNGVAYPYTTHYLCIKNV